MNIQTKYLTYSNTSYISANTNFKIMQKMNTNITQVKKENASLHSSISIQPIVISNLLGIIILSLLSILLIG